MSGLAFHCSCKFRFSVPLQPTDSPLNNALHEGTVIAQWGVGPITCWWDVIRLAHLHPKTFTDLPHATAGARWRHTELARISHQNPNPWASRPGTHNPSVNDIT